MNGTPNVGKHLILKFDSEALVHCKSFSMSNSKGEIDVTSRDSNGQKEYILDGMIDKNLSFSAGVVRPGTSSSGVEIYALLQNFYDSDASLNFEIVDTVSGGIDITGWGLMKDLNIDFGDSFSEVTADGTFRVNDATLGTTT